MVAVSNPSIDRFDDCHSPAADELAVATEEVEFLCDCLVQALNDPIERSQEPSASSIASHSPVQTEADVVDGFVLVGEATALSGSSVHIEVLELIEPDRTDAETTRAMEGLREFVEREERTCAAETANRLEPANGLQVDTQIDPPLLPWAERADLSQVRQLSAEVIEKVNQLEQRLDASHEQLTQLLTLQATETRSKKQSTQRFWVLGLAGLAVLAGLGVWESQRDRKISNRAAASEVLRAIDLLNQIDGLALSGTFVGGNVTLTGTAYPGVDVEEMARTFGQIGGVKSVTHTIKTISPAFSTRVYFEVNSATVISQDIEGKLRPIQQAMQQYPQLRLKIIGHARAGERANGQSNLALARSQAVQTLLEHLGIDRRRTLALSHSASPSDVTPNPSSWLSQYVRFETTMGDR